MALCMVLYPGTTLQSLDIIPILVPCVSTELPRAGWSRY